MCRQFLIGLVISSSVLLSACSAGTQGPGAPPQNKARVDLSGTRTYLLDQSQELVRETAGLKAAADAYYDLARAHNFDYAALWQQDADRARQSIADAKARFLKANPAYELMEGIVAGVNALSQFDVDLDAGIAASEGTEGVVSFDVHLPDGKVLAKPGNFFYLAEVTLWGTRPEWTAQHVQADLDGNGEVAFGEVLPDANVLKGVADAFAAKSEALLQAAAAWQPSEADAFTALVVMIPTMEEYFSAWKESRYVSGDQARSIQFVATSRLQDIADILGGLQVVYQNISPAVAAVDPAQASQIGAELIGLREYVQAIRSKEQAGQKFTAEDADLFGTEAQNRATAIAGQITQAAAKLGVQIDG
jgi:hypothetical protein